MILALYRGLVTLAGPAILLLLARRRSRGKEDPNRIGERRGIAGQARPKGRLIWLHAASVGEAVSMLPVVEALQALPGYHLLLTTGTVTSAKMMASRLPPGAIHQFIPIDRPAWVRRFLDHWRPDLALWAESEFWPCLLRETAARNVPLILLNGRVSDRSFARWHYLPGVIGPLLAGFVLCLGQTERDRARLESLGARNTAYLGNLKFAAPPLPADPASLAVLQAALGDRPRWLAASTHDGEEKLVGSVHRYLAADFPALLTILVPRHPERGAAIARDLRGQNHIVALRSEGENPSAVTQIYIADTLGELGLFYRLAPLVLMGKSLIGQGGQNPLEPARLGASVLFGPHMGNFIDIAQRMREAKAAIQVADQDDLTGVLRARLNDPALLAIEGRAAFDFASAEDGVLPAVIHSIAAWLPALEETDAGA
jgi:3-deoxy-D-manno-octulosonic-acid transferase